jgi:hypothetical protein
MQSAATATPDGNKATVIVRRDGGNLQTEGIVEAHMQSRMMNIEVGLDLSSLDGTDELARHEDEATGEVVEVYGRPHADGGMQVYVVVTGVGGIADRRILAAPHLARLQPDMPASVSLEDGMVNLAFDGGEGNQLRLRLLTARQEDLPQHSIKLDVDQDTGVVKVRMPEILNPTAPK